MPGQGPGTAVSRGPEDKEGRFSQNEVFRSLGLNSPPVALSGAALWSPNARAAARPGPSWPRVRPSGHVHSGRRHGPFAA